MGYKLTKKLSELQRQSQEEKLAKLSLSRAVVLSFLALTLITYLLVPKPQNESWSETTDRTFVEKYNWLEKSYLSIGSGEKYKNTAEKIIASFSSDGLDNESNAPWYSLESWTNSFSRIMIAGLLRISFVFISFWPFWLISIALGYTFFLKYVKPRRGDDILGVCDPGKTPFYSGIHGPLIPNDSISGTDRSAPGLACPARVKKQVALNHKLSQILRNYNAFNETTLGLVEVILAYKNYPSFVEDESRPEEEDRGLDSEIQVSNSNFYTNEAGTIEESSLKCLPALLAAHKVLIRYYNEQEKEGKKMPSYAEYRKLKTELANQLPELGKVLLGSLTRKRGKAISKLPPSVIAATYLALEAGKSLVYTEVSSRFTCQSHYPNLQSRAVLLSLPEFHKEFKGDFRLIMRQAILCSRRHRDFGRAFLPMRMPIEARALRDWLEILYAPDERRTDQGKFVELDAHLEEIQNIWRKNLGSKLKALAQGDEKQLSNLPKLWKGVPYKSVVLMPIDAVIELALNHVENSRIDRVLELMKHAAKFSEIVSVSARLPGFKRQIGTDLTEIADCGEAAQKIAKAKNGKKIIERWFIVQRMLTRYNWLSTRVGDDAVPNDGLVQVVFSTEKATDPLEAAIPIRTRRFRESFGARWESTYYQDTPHPNEIEVFVDPNDFYEQQDAQKNEQTPAS